MRAVIPRPALALAAAAALAACQPPDVGQRCALETWQNQDTRPVPTTISSDYLETGNVACDNLICIVSPVSSGKYSDCPGTPDPLKPQLGQCGYCSKPCVSNQDCYPSQTGLECRQMVLDPAFIQALRDADPALADKYLASVQFSSYCAVPLPPQ
jgi:hypothetical protein